MFAFLHALVAARLLPFFVPYTDVHLATGSIGYPTVTAVPWLELSFIPSAVACLEQSLQTTSSVDLITYSVPLAAYGLQNPHAHALTGNLINWFYSIVALLTSTIDSGNPHPAATSPRSSQSPVRPSFSLGYCLDYEFDARQASVSWHYIDFVVFSKDAAWPYAPDDGALGPPVQLSLPAPKLVLSLPAPAVMLSLPAPVPMLSLPAPPPTLTIDAPKSLWSKPFVVHRNVSCVDGEWTGSLNTTLYLAPVCPVSVSGATLTHGSAFNWRSAATALYMVVLALVPHFIGRRLFRGSHGRYLLDRDASDEGTDWNQERVAESMGEGESEGEVEVEESVEGDLGSDSDNSDTSELAGETRGTEQHKAQEGEEEETDDEEVAERKEEEVDEEGTVQAEVKEVEKGEEAVESEKDAEETEVEEEEETREDVEKAVESREKNVAQTHEAPEGLSPESPDDQEGWTVVTHHKYRAPRSSQVNTVGGPKGRRKGRKNKDVALTPRQLWERRPRPRVAV